jgi:hypothetical protein
VTDRHVFGSNPQPEIIPHKAKHDFHRRWELINANFSIEAKKIAARHTAELAALEEKFNVLHQENSQLAGFRR